jgi:TRAP-type mannitol/chloroaromatic compound transport system permease large subunit
MAIKQDEVIANLRGFGVALWVIGSVIALAVGVAYPRGPTLVAGVLGVPFAVVIARAAARGIESSKQRPSQRDSSAIHRKSVRMAVLLAAILIPALALGFVVVRELVDGVTEPRRSEMLGVIGVSVGAFLIGVGLALHRVSGGVGTRTGVVED